MTKHEKKELKRYRKLGTIEELSHIVEDYKRGLYNLQQPQENRNKQEAKKPRSVQIPFRSEISGIVSFEKYYTCPNCWKKIMDMTKRSYDRLFAPASCPNCGQKLDWSC